MSAGGFVVMPRELIGDPAFGNPARDPYDRFHAFTWLVAEASWAARSVRIPGRTIHLERGQLTHSLRFMARAWGRDDAWVRRALARFVERRLIGCATDAGQVVITVLDYEQYQASIHAASGQKGVTDAPCIARATRERRVTDAKKNQRNQGKKNSPSLQEGGAARPAAMAEPEQPDVLGAPVVPPTTREGVPVGREQELKVEGRAFIKLHAPRMREGQTHELMNSLALAHGGGLDGVERAVGVLNRWLADRKAGRVSEALEPYLRGVITEEKRHGHSVPASRLAGGGARFGFTAETLAPASRPNVVDSTAEEIA